MADNSWEESDGRLSPSMTGPKKLSGAAKPFVFNPGAKAFVPGGGGAPAPAPAQGIRVAQDLATKEVTQRMQTVKLEAKPTPPKEEEEEEEPIDENDPYWQLMLKLANGDRELAMKNLDNDSLATHPEVVAFLEAHSGEAEVEFREVPVTQVPAKSDGAPDSKRSGTASSPAPTGGTKGATADDEAEMPDEKEMSEEDPREHLNLVFIGHVDAGKSTMSGQLLYLTGQVDKRTIERFEREAKQLNRESWFLAFIMDTNEEERAKGKTVEVGRAHFETETKRYTIMDAPGHKNYVPNMIAGAVQADVGILVISARRGEFETGFERGGQTREHALLAKTLGVKYLVVVINKMDDPTVQWARARFDECVSKLKPFLKSCGYLVKKDIKFIPVSGLTGDNILRPVTSSVCPWWEGLYKAGENNTNEPTLVTTLDALHIAGRDPSAALRIPVLDRYYDRGTVVLGKVETGTVRVGMKVLAMPTRNQFEVQAVYINDVPVRSAKPGENVRVKLGGANVEDIQKGFVLCSVQSPCKAVNRFECQLALVDLPETRPIFTSGFEAVVHIHTAEEECSIADLLTVVDKTTGEVKKRPRYARQGALITVRMKLAREICCEAFDEVPQLGRLTLRDEGKTIAIGKILKLL